MKFTPPGNPLLPMEIDGNEFPAVRRSLYLTGALLRHAPACPLCGLRAGPYRLAQPAAQARTARPPRPHRPGRGSGPRRPTHEIQT